VSDVFIAHVEEDADVALEIALGLEEAGYSTWCYEVDSIPGPSYLLQTGQAVERAKAVVIVISPHSLGSRQVTKEVVRAHESGKEFIPVLRGITHIEFQHRQPEWREAVGAAASIGIPLEGITSIISRIVSGLKALDIQPALKTEPARIVQIGKALGELQRHRKPEKTVGPIVRTEESEAEPVATETPSTETVAEARRSQERLEKAKKPIVEPEKPKLKPLGKDTPSTGTTGEARKPQKRWGKPALIASGSIVIIALSIVGFILFGRSGHFPSNPPAPPTVSASTTVPAATQTDIVANKPPQISSMVANPSEILYGGSTTITCIATDTNGDTLEYIWTASDGTITGAGNKVTWTAPNRNISANFDIAVIVSDGKGGNARGDVTVSVSASEKAVILNPVAEETGTVSSDGDRDNSRTMAGDDKENIGYHAFWSFDIPNLQGVKVKSAKLKFTKTTVQGDPFPSTAGLGGLQIWRVNYDAKLPAFLSAVTPLEHQSLFLEQPAEIDVTPDVTNSSTNRFQVEAAFMKPTNDNSVTDLIEWSGVTLTVTYSEK
jgi:hypothetical protein